MGIALAWFARCSPPPTGLLLPLTPPDSFSLSGGQAQSARWWTSFSDSRLNALMNQALDSNFNVLAAWQRFQAAEAVVDREASFLLPDVEAFFTAGRSFPEPDFRGGENQQLGLSVAYEVDLWGRIRTRVQAERYRAEASRLDYQTATLSLSAEIAQTWYRLMARWGQLKLIRKQVATNENILKLIIARFGSGQIRGVDILRQKQLTEATREQQIVAESQIRVLENQLAVLLGVPPQEDIPYAPDSLPTLPPSSNGYPH